MLILRESYDEMVTRGEITKDVVQLSLVDHYDSILRQLYEEPLRQQSGYFAFPGFLTQIVKKNISRVLPCFHNKTYQPRSPVKGLYVYGGVGRGKTMLMDLFFSAVPHEGKKRFHFNDFMNEVHDRIEQHRQGVKHGTIKEANPFVFVAHTLAEEAHIFCLDEFSVTDIADAMILARLFTAFFQKGMILVTTSNVAPQDLYRNGLNRALFLPFIAILEEHVDVVALDIAIDYRLEKTDSHEMYVVLLNHHAKERMDQWWAHITQQNEVKKKILHLRGREIEIPFATSDAARFCFADLCVKPLSAFDYREIARRYPTILIDDVPVFDDECRNEAKRFILLIDVLYDHHVRLVLSAHVPLEQLYQGRRDITEKFEFARTTSRLFEMQGVDYVSNWKQKKTQKG